ncbi:MAG TPA: hypothetical protein VM452_17500 [Caulifigura sp.]|jgi:hypothetical protein|nr:hypothetical protein [Caulifigura sp.]
MQPTKPLVSRILSAGAVRVSHDRTAAVSKAEVPCSPAPRIETRQRNGAISEIVVTCACGQRTVIECDYTDLAAAKQTKAN